jgi:hypothetical protein
MSAIGIPNMKLATLAAAALATGVLALPALAQSQWDTNADGMVSLEELTAVFPDLTEATFVSADLNGDGLLDSDELAAAQASGLIPVTEG